ncbi:MAG: thioesterase family protein [Bosea sp. (in: a-proteobacteria)]
MNLWFRLLWLIISTPFRGRLTPPMDVSRLNFRVWPHDLDTSLHMNNGRYWTLMDLGRTDLLLRTGLWRTVLKNKWVPVVSAGKIRFRRELKPFTPFRLETRIMCWAESWVVMEHRLLSQGRKGEIVNAVALVRVGIYDRAGKAFVPTARLFDELGVSQESPEASPEVAAFLAAEDAMKQAA